ncbi:transcription factor bHLH30-like, partial [Vigna angularis]|uniref:transcription factor bHLH30-like n=1 Tax=Phaseolus angularis TaxID=3914 RepID=UPI0022B35D62
TPSLASDPPSLQFSEFPLWPATITEDRAASASKSHSQAEKRRRDRINAQLATLRKLIPKSDKILHYSSNDFDGAIQPGLRACSKLEILA